MQESDKSSGLLSPSQLQGGSLGLSKYIGQHFTQGTPAEDRGWGAPDQRKQREPLCERAFVRDAGERVDLERLHTVTGLTDNTSKSKFVSLHSCQERKGGKNTFVRDAETSR